MKGSDLDPVKAGKYEQIGKIAKQIREIDGQIKGEVTQDPRFGKKKRQDN
ncbi:MAG: hypothetical protein JW744_02645 [Candidatus Diapherotrites archaeon]|uniref:Uncharacterized protein n=1 Tax=Candidatus Iainarchaeum sp. TaxID=3101447 RepID=A0A938YTQ2_9ARCH|nr:hypothetical protein [Candidatus Diapherotrites archaeon]